MEKGATYEENIKFLISMYKREIEMDEQDVQELPLELREAYENIVIELEAILKLSK